MVQKYYNLPSSNERASNYVFLTIETVMETEQQLATKRNCYHYGSSAV